MRGGGGGGGGGRTGTEADIGGGASRTCVEDKQAVETITSVICSNQCIRFALLTLS